MATRAQIAVEGSSIMIYKHNDGYPNGVMPVLEDLAKMFLVERGNDPEYCLAQILMAFAREEEEHRRKMLALDDGCSHYYKKPFMTGWGLDMVLHGDIEYFYVVDLAAKQIRVYNFLWESTTKKPNLINTVNIAGD